MTFEMVIGALFFGLASMTANSSHRFATVVEEMVIDGSHFTHIRVDLCTM
jgi:pyruvate/2-oxoacid:ferredoxin oxidoreductase alpha subunit